MFNHINILSINVSLPSMNLHRSYIPLLYCGLDGSYGNMDGVFSGFRGEHPCVGK
jgi:hypothetical protein